MALPSRCSSAACRNVLHSQKTCDFRVLTCMDPTVLLQSCLMPKPYQTVIRSMQQFSTASRKFVASVSLASLQRRNLTTTMDSSASSTHSSSNVRHMRAWQLNSYQETPEFSLSHDVAVPKIQQPDDVLVEVNAASINPLDTMMAKGYGRNVTSALRQTVGLMFSDGRRYSRSGSLNMQQTTFPLTLGRDFSGTVVDVGPGVTRKFKIGDAVYGTVGAHRPGSHAEYVVTSANCIGHRPSEISDVEAASLPWIACTTYSALVYSGNLTPTNASQRSVLLIGAGGGLGTFAVQLLKSAWNANVVAMVHGPEQASIVRSNCAGLDAVIDSKQNHDFLHAVEQHGPYDLLLDAAGDADTANQCANFLRGNHLSSHFVTLSSPLLNNTDKYRLIPGTAKSALNFAKNYLGALNQGYQYHWAFYMPNGKFLDGDLNRYLREHKIKPVIQKEFGFAELPRAFEAMKQSSRGKIVINMKREKMV